MSDIILPKRCELISDCFFKIEEWVLLCAIEAIETAMSEQTPDWFSVFKAGEESEDKPIVSDKTHKIFTSVGSLDFQAAMKIFFHRREQFAAVYNKYNLSAEDNSDFVSIVSRLIKTRNDIIGHLDADSIKSKYAEMDSDQALRLIHKFREGILDFITFLNFFPDICDSDGESYVSKAKTERIKTEKLLNIFRYNIQTTIADENLPITVSGFEQLCKRLGISYSSDDDGNSYFETENYKKTVKSIKALVEEIIKKPVADKTEASPKKNTVMIIVFVLIILLLLGVLCMLIFGNSGNNQKQGEEDKTPTSSTIESYVSQGGNVVNYPSSEESVLEEIDPEITGKGILGGLTVRIDCIPSQYLTFTYENKGTNSYSFGWVPDYSQVIVETSVRKYYGTVSGTMVKLNKDSEGTFNASFEEEFEGIIKKITITKMTPLNDNGLPQGESLTLKIPIKYK